MKKQNKGLNKTEIAELDIAFMKIFKMYLELRKEMKIAERIKFPSIPSVFSESMVILAANILFKIDESWQVERGGRACDVLIKKDALQQRVEVKATGKKETLEIKERDINCDWLVWINFGSRYESGKGAINIYVLHYPYNYLDPADTTNRITNLTKFREKIGKTKNLSIFKFNSLKDFLSFCKESETN